MEKRRAVGHTDGEKHHPALSSHRTDLDQVGSEISDYGRHEFGSQIPTSVYPKGSLSERRINNYGPPWGEPRIGGQ
jgi:hypothetical protein